MTQHLPWTAIIPLRKGSKGLPNKNTLLLAGYPLYTYTVKAALKAGADKIIITTDIPELLNLLNLSKINKINKINQINDYLTLLNITFEEYQTRIIIVERPASLCSDTATMTQVLSYTIQSCCLKGVIVLLQATSPLRNEHAINNALSLWNNTLTHPTPYTLVMSVTQAPSSILKWGVLNETGQFIPVSKPEYCFMNRQQLPTIVRPNGAIYVFDALNFIQYNHGNAGFNTDNIGALTMTEHDSLDIDTIDDFKRCESILTILT